MNTSEVFTVRKVVNSDDAVSGSYSNLGNVEVHTHADEGRGGDDGRLVNQRQVGNIPYLEKYIMCPGN